MSLPILNTYFRLAIDQWVKYQYHAANLYQGIFYDL
jgi:hypothetical protein